jgi:hypothetical protein
MSKPRDRIWTVEVRYKKGAWRIVENGDAGYPWRPTTFFLKTEAIVHKVHMSSGENLGYEYRVAKYVRGAA